MCERETKRARQFRKIFLVFFCCCFFFLTLLTFYLFIYFLDWRFNSYMTVYMCFFKFLIQNKKTKLPYFCFSLWARLCAGFPGETSGREPTCRCRRCERAGSIPESGRSPGGGHSNPLQYSYLPGGLQAWGCRDSDTTEVT